MSTADCFALQARNRPKEPPKLPPAAPFFLPTVPDFTGQPQFAEPGAADDASSAEEVPFSASRVHKGPLGAPAGVLLQALRAEDGFETAMVVLAQLSALEIDQQLRAMQVRLAQLAMFVSFVRQPELRCMFMNKLNGSLASATCSV